ncbi:hypothetical protein L6164_032889 [Bauhinia variegata]|uniref:Uncharacterized protein n=1 Tax=Bauhinia variegata TaxID=167791 RepID=A0ACB9KQ45_BAUVA|nr:hypothetical protein L6164_032889 [Bauhinia variegata]
MPMGETKMNLATQGSQKVPTAAAATTTITTTTRMLTRKNGERQGMSDTRYVEAGKYYFHVPDSPSGVNTKNWNNYKGYFGNNNANSFENNNMERYQNSEEFEDEEEP